MVVSARVLLLTLALVAARANIASRDNILRIQLWDAEGLSKEPITTTAPTTTKSAHRKSKVNLDSLYNAMIYEGYGGDFGRFTRHKVRHKRRRPRQSGTGLPWRFHAGDGPVNVVAYDDDVPWSAIEAVTSAVSVGEVNASRDVPAPMTLRQDEDEVMSKQLSLSALSPPEVVNSYSRLIGCGGSIHAALSLHPGRRCVDKGEWPSLFFKKYPCPRLCVVIVSPSGAARMECKYFLRGDPIMGLIVGWHTHRCLLYEVAFLLCILLFSTYLNTSSIYRTNIGR